MEGEHGSVAEAGGADAVFRHAEGVGGVINDLEAVLLRDAVYLLHIAEVAVDMHGHDGDGLIGDKRLELADVDGIVGRVNVAEHRCAAAADDRVRGGGKGERRGDDLALELHGLDDIFKREVAIREQSDIWHTEVLLQLRFEPLVLFTHIGEPMAVPNAADLIAVFLKLRDG